MATDNIDKDKKTTETEDAAKAAADEAAAKTADAEADAADFDAKEASGGSEAGKSCDSDSDKKTKKSDSKKLKETEKALKAAEKELDDAKSKLEEQNDRYLRLAAEYDNFRRRSKEEKDSIYSDACLDVLTEILPVIDNLERAAAFEGEAADGVRLTLKQFTETLTKLGVAEIPALDQPFDPNVHNAVMHVEDDSLGENIVCDVFQKGYIRGEKVLRYAMVKVAN